LTFEIEWYGNFGILWAYEKERFVVTAVFEDKTSAFGSSVLHFTEVRTHPDIV